MAQVLLNTIHENNSINNESERIIHSKDILLSYEELTLPDEFTIQVRKFIRDLCRGTERRLVAKQSKVYQPRSSSKSGAKKSNVVNKENLENQSNTQIKHKQKDKSKTTRLAGIKKSNLKASKSQEKLKSTDVNDTIPDVETFLEDKTDPTERALVLEAASGGSKRNSRERQLEQRQKQIQYGYNTIGYQNYIKLIPKDQRKKGMPVTPDKYQNCSKRSWDGQVRKWRRALHNYDPEPETIQETSTLEPVVLEF